MSAEAPAFQTVSDHADMTVVGKETCILIKIYTGKCCRLTYYFLFIIFFQSTLVNKLYLSNTLLINFTINSRIVIMIKIIICKF